MKKLSSAAAILIAVSAVALALVFLYAYFLHALSETREKQQDFAGEIRSADKIIAEEEANKADIARYFLKDGEQALFVSNLEALCGKLSLACDTRSLTEMPDSSGAAKLLGMVISAEGQFTGVMELLSYFESAPYPIEVSKSALFSKEPEAPSRLASSEWEGVFELTVPVSLSNAQ